MKIYEVREIPLIPIPATLPLISNANHCDGIKKKV